MSYLASLTDRRDPFVTGPNWEITSPTDTIRSEAQVSSELKLSLQPLSGGYAISFDGGAFLGGNFFSPLTLQPATFTLAESTQQIEGFNTAQYQGSTQVVEPASGEARAYAVSVQTLTGSGMGVVGMGHWKYLGDFQRGYFQGTRHVHGAFLFGQPTALSQVAGIPTGSYAGYSQAGAEAYYFDAFDQVTSRASVHYDAGTRIITIRLAGFKLRSGNFGYARALTTNLATASQAMLPNVASCSGKVSTANGQFTCRFSGWYAGKVKGKFFGDRGQLVAGTYELEGTVSSTGSDGLVGGFIAQRHVTTGEPIAPSAGAAAWQVPTARLSISSVVGNTSSATLRMATAASNNMVPNVVVLDDQGLFNPDVQLNYVANGQWDMSLRTYAQSQVGARSGTLTVRLCYDEALVCARPVPGSPWKLPYDLSSKAYPGPNPSFTPLEGVVYLGTSSILTTEVSLSELPVLNNSGSSYEQYRYTITSSGVLDPLISATGTWYNQLPNEYTHANRLISFASKSGLSTGIYDGTVSLSICGISWADYSACMPVERPVIEIPYHLQVFSWRDTRALSLAPEVLALANQRGSAQERMSFPLVTPPSGMSVRWRVPEAAFKLGVGQGVVFASSSQDDGGQRLNVYSEVDGRLLWSRTFASNGSYSGLNFTVVASNQRLFVSTGGYGNEPFKVQVFNAMSGALVAEKSCGNCAVRWSNSFGNGFAARIYDYSIQLDAQWVYDDRSDEWYEGDPHTSSDAAAVLLDDTDLMRTFFKGVKIAPPAQEGVAPECPRDANIGASGWMWLINPQTVCYVPAFGRTRWSASASDFPAWANGATYLSALEEAGTVAVAIPSASGSGELAQVSVRRAQDGSELTRLSSRAWQIARSANLIFLGGERIEAYDFVAQKVVWSLPYPGEVIGISNAGVLYVRVQIAGSASGWHIAAINLK